MRPTKKDLDEIKRSLTARNQRTFERALEHQDGGVVDGLYLTHPRTGEWCLSIYRNVINAGNDVEVAFNAAALDGAEAQGAAGKWIDRTLAELQHGPSGIHKANRSTTHRAGMTLEGVRELARRLTTQLLAETGRWDSGSRLATPSSETPTAEPARKVPTYPAALLQMLANAHSACEQSGKSSVTVAKMKEFRFGNDEEFLAYVLPMLEAGKCAITGIPLDLTMTDLDLAPSLDRKDSGGHYERGNLQVVARFINRWKSDDGEQNFRRLLDLVKAPRE